MRDFEIGQWVHVTAITKGRREPDGSPRRSLSSKRAMKQFPCSGEGVIVGIGKLYGGTIVCGWEDGSEFTRTSTHTFWLVRLGWLNKPKYVRDEDMEAIDGTGHVLPHLYKRGAGT